MLDICLIYSIKVESSYCLVQLLEIWNSAPVQTVVCINRVFHKIINVDYITGVLYRSVSHSAVVLAVRPRDRYQQLVQDGTIDNDPHQVIVVDALEQLHGQLNGYVPSTKSSSLLRRVCALVVCGCV